MQMRYIYANQVLLVGKPHETPVETPKVGLKPEIMTNLHF